ncbi:aliphatic sulfonate ABC transporter substrate-binding protein [Carnimonas bestiolae]|uniref:aliphatic sulfonate ABC transporter substrate-binding protein n=1 Tax=Carnimonas bestiolae TaxID=3402172 RepID=UPI003EDBBF67
MNASIKRQTPLLAGLIAVAMGVVSSTALAAQPDTLTVGYQKANIFQLLKSRGTLDEAFKKQGTQVKWVQFAAGPQMLEALNLGSIDVAATGDAPPAFAQAAQADLVYLGHSPANPETEAIVVPKDSDIRAVKDLKGKRVALNKGSDVNYLLVKALQKAGLSYSDIQPVYLTPDSARAAFQSGAIDAWAIWDPFLSEAEQNAGARELTNAKGLAPHYTFYLASRTFADGSPDTAKAFISELQSLSDWANHHQGDVAKLLTNTTGLEQGIWQKVLGRAPFGIERMSNKVYDEQQQLADTFTAAHLLPGKVDVRSALWSQDSQLKEQ